jgi:hypothetical protein
MVAGKRLLAKILVPREQTEPPELPADLPAFLDPANLVPMPEAAYLCIEAEDDGAGFFTIRHGADGGFGGDDWHKTLAEALEDAKAEFGDDLSEWIEVPADVKDVFAFALKAKW